MLFVSTQYLRNDWSAFKWRPLAGHLLLVFPLYAQKKMRATRAEERSRWKGLHLLIFSALSQWLCSNASRIVEATCSRPHQWCDVALFESFRDVTDRSYVMSVWSTSRSILLLTYTYVHLFTFKSHQIQDIVYECTCCFWFSWIDDNQ